MKKILAPLVLLNIVLISNSFLSAQWVKVSNGMAANKVINSLTTGSNEVIFAATNDSGIFRSTNNGINWIHCSQIPVGVSWAVYAWGSIIFAGSNGNGIYRSSNNGISWNQENAGLNSFSPREFVANDTLIFSVLRDDAVYRSPNGYDWYSGNSGIPSYIRYFTDLAELLGNLFVSTNFYYPSGSGGVYKSTNNGVNWLQVNNGLPITGVNSYISALGVIDTLLFAATDAGVFRSSNFGTNWITSNQGINGTVQTFFTLNTNFLAGSTAGFFRSTNRGNTWTVFNQGLTPNNVLSLTVDDVYIYAGTNGGSVYRRPLNEIIILEVHNISNEIPEKFNITQNFPNPFNPTTKIKFDIPIKSFVRLVIYNSLGKEIDKLVHEELNAGSYQADWDASENPSGVYFYSIEAGDFVQTRSMVLLK